MIKRERLPKNIMERVPAAASALAERPEVVFAYLFGSLAAGGVKPLSDVDIAVYMAEPYDFVEAKLALLDILMDSLGTEEIDLLILNTAPLSLAGRIMGAKQVIVDKQPFARHEFESLTLRKYWDFARMEKDILGRRYSVG